jgi:hypothetical protein
MATRAQEFRAQDLRTIGDLIERRLDELRAIADPRLYDRAEELLRLMTELYGAWPGTRRRRGERGRAGGHPPTRR